MKEISFYGLDKTFKEFQSCELKQYWKIQHTLTSDYTIAGIQSLKLEVLVLGQIVGPLVQLV
jgi:hypothetical protein